MRRHLVNGEWSQQCHFGCYAYYCLPEGFRNARCGGYCHWYGTTAIPMCMSPPYAPWYVKFSLRDVGTRRGLLTRTRAGVL